MHVLTIGSNSVPHYGDEVLNSLHRENYLMSRSRLIQTSYFITLSETFQKRIWVADKARLAYSIEIVRPAMIGHKVVGANEALTYPPKKQNIDSRGTSQVIYKYLLYYS